MNTPLVFKNVGFTKRNYDCTNVVAAVSLDGSNPSEPGIWRLQFDETILTGLTQLYRVNDVRYYGYL